MRSGADISPGGVYRYLLWREWDDSLDRMVWIMLNPSTADADANDLTITKCMEFANRAGCGGIEVIDLYSLRATQPVDLLAYDDPEGERNVETWDEVLNRTDVGPIVGAWGGSAPRGVRASLAYRKHVIAPEQRPEWLCLGKTAAGQPRHPSRLGYDTELVAL